MKTFYELLRMVFSVTFAFVLCALVASNQYYLQLCALVIISGTLWTLLEHNKWR